MGKKTETGAQYIKEVGVLLPYGAKEKKRYLFDLSNSVEDYLMEHPNAEVGELCDVFGWPEELASSILEEEDGEKLNKRVRSSKQVKLYVLIACLIVVLAGVAFWIYVTVENISYREGYYVTEIIVNSEEE